jgi:hypothetical protein
MLTLLGILIGFFLGLAYSSWFINDNIEKGNIVIKRTTKYIQWFLK